MWLVIVIGLSLGLGVLALIGLLVLVRELFCEGSLDAGITDVGDATARHHIGHASARRSVLTR
jgi:hypothetical protein